MLSRSRRDPEDESLGLQKVIRRSFVYVYFPVIILAVLAMNLIWEVIRQNAPAGATDSWPLRFTVLNTPTTAALLGAIGALLIGRMQWAHAHRPAIGYAIDDEGAKFDPDSDEWRVWLHNGGPGIARVASFEYVVRFVGQPSSVPISLTELNRALESHHLVDGKDYFIRWLGKGFPLAAVNQYTNGIQIARFSVRALAEFEELDVHVTAVDGVGDTHERTLMIMDRLPSVTKNAVSEIRAAKGHNPQR